LRKPYTEAEVSRWAEIIRKHAVTQKDVYVYFKHEETGSGPKFARQLLKELGMEKQSADDEISPAATAPQRKARSPRTSIRKR
jgi:uncharacterized protein YecE (DUF72 family)